MYDKILEALDCHWNFLYNLGVKRIDIYTYEPMDDFMAEFDIWIKAPSLCYMVDKYGVIKKHTLIV